VSLFILLPCVRCGQEAVMQDECHPDWLRIWGALGASHLTEM
jgi:hypothetical protein